MNAPVLSLSLAIAIVGAMPSAAQSSALALAPKENAEVLTLDDVLTLVDERGVAVRVARAEEAIAIAQTARAFSVLLPRVDIDGSYAFNCNVGENGYDCADQTAQFVSDDFLAGQELLFHSVADGTRAQAQQVPDPAQQQALIAKADALDDAGTTIGKTDNTPLVVAPAHVASGNLTVSVPLLVLPAWTALENANDAAQFCTLATKEAKRLSRWGATRAYLAAAQKERVREVASARLRDATSRRSALEAAEAAGAVAALVVDGARLEEFAAEAGLVDADAAAASARARLGVVIGRGVEFAVDGSVVDVYAGRAVDSAAVVADRAGKQRIELQTAALQQRLADREGRAAWQGFVPEVRAFAQLRGTTNVSGFVDAPLGTSLGIGLRWNLWDGGERQGRADAAAANVDIATARGDDARATAFAEARGAVSDVARARAIAAVALRAAGVAKDRLTATELAVSTGARSDVDLVAAASAKNAADVDLVSARTAVALAVVNVAVVAGD